MNIWDRSSHCQKLCMTWHLYELQPEWGTHPSIHQNVFCSFLYTLHLKHWSIFGIDFAMTSSKADLKSVTRVPANLVNPGTVFTDSWSWRMWGWRPLYFNISWHECLAWMNWKWNFLNWLKVRISRIRMPLNIVFRNLHPFFSLLQSKMISKTSWQTLANFARTCQAECNVGRGPMQKIFDMFSLPVVEMCNTVAMKTQKVWHFWHLFTLKLTCGPNWPERSLWYKCAGGGCKYLRLFVDYAN